MKIRLSATEVRFRLGLEEARCLLEQGEYVEQVGVVPGQKLSFTVRCESECSKSLALTQTGTSVLMRVEKAALQALMERELSRDSEIVGMQGDLSIAFEIDAFSKRRGN